MVRQPASDSVYWHAPPAAAAVQAGAPEPSLTRHIRCPGTKEQTAVARPSPLSNCDRLPIVATYRLRGFARTAFAAPLGEAAHREMFVLIPNALSPSPRSASRPLRLFLLHRLPSLPGSPFYAIENFLPYSKDLLFVCPRGTCFPLYDRLRLIKTLRWKK